MAEAFARRRRGAVCAGRDPADRRLPRRGDARISFDQRRAAAHWPGRGRRHSANGVGGGPAMIHLPASVWVHLCLSPCDMRRSFDGLHALVRDHLKLDAFRRGISASSPTDEKTGSILYWDRSGFAIWAKRLEAGVFAIPSGEPSATSFEITVEELGALLSGIDLSTATRRKRYQRAGT